MVVDQSFTAAEQTEKKPCHRSKLMGYIWLSELQARLRRSGARMDCFATQPG
jgi:hypothetical protein